MQEEHLIQLQNALEMTKDALEEKTGEVEKLKDVLDNSDDAALSNVSVPDS